VEVGADDGIRFSNTLYFERELGWSGICVEPKPSVFDALRSNRKCVCVNGAIAKEPGKVEFLEIEGYGRQLSGIVANYDAKHKERIESETQNPATIAKRVISVDAFPLTQLIAQHGFDRINLLSIDTEGSELTILSSIDFDQADIDVILIENNYRDDYPGKVPGLARDFALHHAIQHDEIYIRRDIRQRLMSEPS